MISTKSGRRAVLSLGRIYCDFVFTGLAGMPRLGREVFAEDLTLALGGGAFITAAHIAAHGRKSALLARYGTDPLSSSLESQLAVAGLDLRFLDRHVMAGPQVTAVMVSGGERAFLSRRAGNAEPATLPLALDWPEATHLHIAEFATLAEIPGLVARAKAKGLTVSLDPSWDETLIHAPDFLDRCAGVDIFLPNAGEASAVTRHADPHSAIAALAAHFPVVALKRGPEGALLATGGAIHTMAAPKVKVLDTTGAGDAFNAGFLDAWLDGHPAETCLAQAIASGSASVQALGGTTSLTNIARAG
jgi:sugar/nucleoside kinase (ribokinase family)